MEGPLIPRCKRTTAITGGMGLALALAMGWPAAAQGQERPREEPSRGHPEAPREAPKAAPREEPARPSPEAKPAQQHPASTQGSQPAGQAAPETKRAPYQPKAPQPAPGQAGPANPSPRPQGSPQQAQPANPSPHLQANPQRPAPGPYAGHPPKVTPPPVTITHTPGGGEIHRGPGGVVREVRTPTGAVIHYAPDGVRRVEVARPDGRVLVASPGGRVGYVQRPLNVQGQAFVQRTYVSRGVTVARVYRPWPYHGVTYQVYQPSRFYRPGYYAWSCQPWRQPVHYGWGWGGDPWFFYCRGYWHPYPYHVSPVFWLADFCLSVTFQEAYENRQDCAAPPPPPPPGEMSPAAQQAIADEVRRQIQDEQAQQQGASQGYLPAPTGAPPLFSDNVSRVFMVYAGVPAYLNGLEYYLTEGDVLQLRGARPPMPPTRTCRCWPAAPRACPRGAWCR